MLNSVGPRMEHCGTPVITFFIVELDPFIVTNIFLSVKQLLIILMMASGVLIL